MINSVTLLKKNWLIIRPISLFNTNILLCLLKTPQWRNLFWKRKIKIKTSKLRKNFIKIQSLIKRQLYLIQKWTSTQRITIQTERWKTIMIYLISLLRVKILPDYAIKVFLSLPSIQVRLRIRILSKWEFKMLSTPISNLKIKDPMGLNKTRSRSFPCLKFACKITKVNKWKETTS